MSEYRKVNGHIQLDKLEKIGTIDCTPTPTGYARYLIAILQNGNATGKQWAEDEVIRLVKAAATITPDAWGKE